MGSTRTAIPNKKSVTRVTAGIEAPLVFWRSDHNNANEYFSERGLKDAEPIPLSISRTRMDGRRTRLQPRRVLSCPGSPTSPRKRPGFCPDPLDIYSHPNLRDVSSFPNLRYLSFSLPQSRSLDVRRKVDEEVVRLALQEGKDRLDTVRLMVLGGAARGKTSTIASLRRKAFRADREPTGGVEVKIYHVILGDRYASEEMKDALLKRDRFQAKFRAFASRNSNRRKHMEEAAGTDSDWSMETDSLSDDDVLQGDLDSDSHCDVRSTRSNVSNGGASAGSETAVETAASESIAPAFRQRDSAENEVHHEEVHQHAMDLSGGDEALNELAVPDGITLRCWDFGGQREYEVAHELFISPRSIIMFVFDLTLFEKGDSREAEVLELRHWIQAVFAATSGDQFDPTGQNIVIVGTKRDLCRRPSQVPSYLQILRGMLTEKLDDVVTSCWNMCEVRMIAIENSIAVQDIQDSGLGDLEGQLERTAGNIIRTSQETPLRWLGFLESLRLGDGATMMSISQHAVEERMQGFHFPLSRIDRSKEVDNFLKYFRDLGEIVLFDNSRLGRPVEGSFYHVFLNPERILHALKVIVAPEEIRCDGLSSGRDRDLVRQGLLTSSALEDKWGHIAGLESEAERVKLVDLLTSMDIFINLRSERLLGVPSLRQKGWDDWEWLNCAVSKRELSAVTTFRGFFPFGLVGTLIGRLHRTVGAENTDIRYVRANAILLTLGLAQPGKEVYQVFVGFDFDNRELHWKVRGQRYNPKLLGACLYEFENHRKERLHGSSVQASHFFLADCPRGCSRLNFRLKFAVPRATQSEEYVRSRSEEGLDTPWWQLDNMSLFLLSDLCGKSICENENCYHDFSLLDALQVSEQSQSPGSLRSKTPNEYVAFVSHAGEDKIWAERITERLEGQGMRTFVDRQELKGSHHKAGVLMEQALRTASLGVFITSPEVFGRRWPMKELRTLLRRYAEEPSDSPKILIYPIFHRLSYHDCSNPLLCRDPQYHACFMKEGFFDAERQRACSTDDAIAAMKELCAFSGLEKKDPEMHAQSKERSLLWYSLLALKRTVLWLSGKNMADGDLGGVTTEEFFDFSATRIARAYRSMIEDDGASSSAG